MQGYVAELLDTAKWNRRPWKREPIPLKQNSFYDFENAEKFFRFSNETFGVYK